MPLVLLGLLAIAAVIAWAAWNTFRQLNDNTASATSNYRQPVEAGSFIVAMILLAAFGLVFIPLAIVLIIFW